MSLATINSTSELAIIEIKETIETLAYKTQFDIHTIPRFAVCFVLSQLTAENCEAALEPMHRHKEKRMKAEGDLSTVNSIRVKACWGHTENPLEFVLCAKIARRLGNETGESSKLEQSSSTPTKLERFSPSSEFMFTTFSSLSRSYANTCSRILFDTWDSMISFSHLLSCFVPSIYVDHIL